MRKKTLLLLLVLGVLASLFITPSVALAWTDISDSDWVNTYGVTAAQVATVADGFPDGTFHPRETVTRGQFAKMSVKGLGLSTANPAVPTYTDVPKNHPFYIYVEGATNGGIIQGLGGGLFGPAQTISRQQVATILARYLSARELAGRGYILGSTGSHYGSLAAWFAAEGEQELAAFTDNANISATHRQGVAYLAMLKIAQGVGGRFNPLLALTRAQSAAVILRALDAAGGFTPELQLPTITSISPTSGPEAGGTVVTINGTNFTNTATVKFGTKAATGVTFVSSTKLTAVAPSGTGNTTVDVSVTTSAGSSANTAADNYYYVSATAPTITSLSPTSGPAEGGTVVTINGTNFTNTATVKFGTKAATGVTFVSSIKLTAVAPAGTAGTTVDVIVTTDQGTSANTAADNYQYLDTNTPSITSLSPNHGPYIGGNTVTITGTNFPSDETDVQVYFGTKLLDDSNVIISSSTSMKVTAPAGTAGQTVRVKIVRTDVDPDTTSPDTEADDYTYDEITGPFVTSVSPAAGDVGDTIKIYGGGFGTDANAITVWFGDKPAEVVSVNDTGTLIQAKAPAGTGVVDVLVNVAGAFSANTLADDFSYDSPEIDALIPDKGPTSGGNTVSIVGSGFAGTMKVYFDTKKLSSTSVQVVSPTLIQVVAPSWSSEAAVSVKVVNSASTPEESGSVDYEYVKNLPVVTSLSKSAGTPDGGTSVTIYGKNFGSNVDKIIVWFGSAQADVVSVNAAGTQITVKSPGGSEGDTVDVSVEVDGVGASADTPADDFAYGKPEVTSIDPSEGDTDGGTTVTITGTGFTPDVVVKFGSTTVDAANISVGPDNDTITVVSPAHSAGTAHVRVTNDYGTSDATDDDVFTYVAGLADPVVSGLDPSEGPAAGGTEVTITGDHFTYTATVKFGSATARVLDFIDARTLKVEAPAGTAGKTVDVRVTVGGNTSKNTTADNFTYLPNGTLTGKDLTLTPAYGPIKGGNTIEVSVAGGDVFSTKPTVKVGTSTVDPANVTVVDGSTLEVVMPSVSSAKKVAIKVQYSTSNASNTTDYQYFNVTAQWKVSGGSTWNDWPSSTTTTPLTNGATIDLRLLITDESKNPLGSVDLSALYPRAYYSTGGSAAGPLSSTTGSEGELVWENLGGLSNTTKTFYVGFDYNNGGTLTSSEFYKTMKVKWQ